MKIMERIRHTPGWAMAEARSLIVRKNLVPLAAGICILLGIIGGDGVNPSPQFLATAEENKTEKRTYSGRIVNSNGVPVVDAEIRYAVNWQSTQLVARTATDGAFRFEMPRPDLRKLDGRLNILITHADFANHWRKLPLENTTDIEIQLDAPGIISGRVLNSTGEPILDAEVRIQFLMSGDRTSPHREDYSMLDIFRRMSPAETDEDGEFVFRNLPQSAVTMLYIRAPGYAKAERMGVPVGAKGLEIRLKHEGRIQGRLSYADTGAPGNRRDRYGECYRYDLRAWERGCSR